MSKPAASTTDEADFVLKHRIAGAGFLLFFGALFLPWLLGPPSEALKAEEPPEVESQIELSASEIEDELLAVLRSDREDVPEQVYISKITPLDEAAKSEEANKPADTDQSVDASQPALKEKSSEKKDKSKPEAVASKKLADSKAAKPEKDKNQSPVTSTPSPVKEAKPEKIDVGWVVQVGVFEKPEGVAKELAYLREQGFEPSTSEMDTNQKLGKATRIWLGPFGRRVDAAKTKSRLTDKTGKAGYIRAYP